ARAALADCWAALRAENSLSADVRRSLDYVLLEYELSIVSAFQPPEAVRAQFAVTYRAISELAPAGPESGIVQTKILISLVGMGARREFIHLDASGMDA